MKRFELEDRTVVLSGAARGLGAALCRRFAAEGCRIGALDIDRQGLESLGRELQGGGVRAAWQACDLADEDAVRGAVDLLRERLGPADVVVANAGITHLQNFTRGESAAVRRVMAVNFFGAVHLLDACFEDLLARRGMAVAISSVAGYAPLVGRTAYSASKHALHGFFDTLRCELRQTGVGVLLVCPSYIATGIRRHVPEERPGQARRRVVGSEDSPEQVAAQIVAAVLARRRFLATGRTGRLVRLIHRLSPRLYEILMLRRVRQEL